MISFSIVREDSTIETNNITNNHKNILIIGSGGCTLFNILANFTNKNIYVLDFNIHQIYLIQLKLSLLLYYDDIQQITEFYDGNHDEKTFIDILNNLNLDKNIKNYWLNNIYLLIKGLNKIGKFEQLFKELRNTNYDFKSCFNDDNLIEYFGEDAVKYSSNFDIHFEEVFNKLKSTNNYFYDQ